MANPPSLTERTQTPSQIPQQSSNSVFLKKISDIKNLFKPSLTSFFQCTFQPPPAVTTWLGEKGIPYDYASTGNLISILCSDASLPGSSLMTNEVTDDYTGVTERFAYRRQYDDRADFTFYVDHNVTSNPYNIILFFEYWISYIVDEQISSTPGLDSPAYSYRINYPENYRSAQGVTINKFEKELSGKYLNYTFYYAYPISISSMPVSYDSISLLKCTVSFTYLRYGVKLLSHSAGDIQGQLALNRTSSNNTSSNSSSTANSNPSTNSSPTDQSPYSPNYYLPGYSDIGPSGFPIVDT